MIIEFHFHCNLYQDHVSIMRWNDGNYWALKASTEKSHRTLVKFMKKWKVQLQLKTDCLNFTLNSFEPCVQIHCVNACHYKYMYVIFAFVLKLYNFQGYFGAASVSIVNN